MERKVLDVSRNIVDGGEEELFNHLWCKVSALFGTYGVIMCVASLSEKSLFFYVRAALVTS